MAAMATVEVANPESLSWTAWVFHINLAAVMGAEPKAFVEVVQQGQCYFLEREPPAYGEKHLSLKM